MVIDTSAVVAVLLREPDYPRYREALVAAVRPAISAATWCEAAMVLASRLGRRGPHELDALLGAIEAVVVPVDDALARTAHLAWQRFGKGRHPAGLNFGDCFSYALAKQRDEPLLFKGDDFSRTDVAAAIP